MNSQRSLSLLIRITIIVFLFFGFAKKVAAQTYYVDATGGSDVAAGTTEGTAWQTISKVNGTTLVAGDNVFLKRGETWNEQLNITTSGLSGNLITFGAYDAGDKPIVDAQGSRPYAINFTSGLSYVKLENLKVRNATTGNIFADGTGTNVSLEAIESVAGFVGIWIGDKSDSSFQTISVINATNADEAAFRIFGSSATDVDFDGITVSGNAGYGLEIDGLTTVTIDNMTLSSNGKTGIRIDSASSVTIENSTSQTNTGIGSGFLVNDSSSVTFENCIANNNAWNGFEFTGAGSNFTFNKNKSHHNGTNGSINSGNGAIVSGTISALKIHQFLAYENRGSGLSLSESGSGEILSSTFYSNGESGFTKGGYYSRVSGGDGWNVRNNIFKDNYPYELNLDANGWNNTTTIDYNLYHHTANAEVVTLDNTVTTINWDTYHTTNGNEDNSLYGDSLFTAAASGDFSLQELSPAVDMGVQIAALTQGCTGTCLDFASNNFYGTPDIGAYEYQPSKTMSGNSIDITGGAVVYEDGKYRNSVTPSSSLASLVIQPSAGFSVSEYEHWMDITIVTWETSGTYTKQWTESSDLIGSDSTSHAVGDLENGTNYDVYYTKQGGSKTKIGFYEADSSGEIAFVYEAGYSQVTFDVEEGDNEIPVITNTTDALIVTNTASVAMTATTSESASCRFSLESGTDFDSMTSFSTTGGTTHNKSFSATVSEDRSYYVLCKDTSDNLSAEKEITFSITVTEVSGLKPKLKISNSKKLTFKKLSQKLYSKNNRPKFSGESEALANGKVVIYVDGDEEEESEADALGKWSEKVKFKKNKTYELKFKYYDRNDALIDSKKYKLKIDTEDPEFISFPPELISKRVGELLWWEAEDNHKIKRYKVYFGGKKIKTKEANFSIPGGTMAGIHTLKIKAYDKAGNKEERSVNIRVR